MRENIRVICLFIFMLTMIVISSFPVLATKPTLPPCHEVENQEYYKNLVYNSDIFMYFKEWLLESISVPCQYEGGSVNVVLKYITPPYYSPNNLRYFTTVTFSFQEGQLVNMDELQKVFRNYQLHIETFELNKMIKFFIQATGINTVEHSRNNIFLLVSSEGDNLEYDFIDNSIKYFRFVNLQLIDNLALFMPSVNNIPQFEEFKRYKRIKLCGFNSGPNNIMISENSRCPTCGSYFYFDFNRRIITSFFLDNNYEWKTFPEVSKVHNIIKEKLLVGELSDCTIADGNMHNYTILHNRVLLEERCFLTVAIKCNNGKEWKDLEVTLNPDGTYGGHRIK